MSRTCCEQAMQGGLVDDGTLDQGGAAVFGGEGHRVETCAPARCEVAHDPDPVPTGVGCSIDGWGVHRCSLGAALSAR